MKTNVLILEKDNLVRQILQNTFSSFGRWKIHFCNDFKDLNNSLLKYNISLVIIGHNSFTPNTLNICRYIKQINPTTGIIIITGNQDVEFDKNAYMIGVDNIEYKPFVPKNLFFKAVNLFRRVEEIGVWVAEQHKRPNYTPLYQDRFIIESDIVVDLESGNVSRSGKILSTLGNKETKLFSLLYQNLYDTVTYDQVRELIFHDISVKRTTITTMIKRLREKFTKVHCFKFLNIRSIGYKLDINLPSLHDQSNP